MASVNKVILVGHLGRDPEVRYSASGDAVCNLSLATSSRWQDKQSGEQREETEWHRVVLYRRQAEVAGEYLKKGSLAYIEGRLRTRKWQDKSGQDRYTTEIDATELKLLGGRSDNETSNNAHSSAATPPSPPTATANRYRDAKEGRTAPAFTPSSASEQGSPLAGMDDDIPF